MKKPPINEQQRRQQIMDAFIVHVVEKGFHKASMAEMAKTAGLSVGQIYRYFAHKEDIIRAVVEQKTEEYIGLMEDFLEKRDWLQRHFEEGVDADFHRDRVLNMEIKAEANRSSVIAQIQRDADQRLHTHATHIIKRRYALQDDEDIQARVDFLVALTEGLFYRSELIQRPFSNSAYQLYEHMLNELLPDP